MKTIDSIPSSKIERASELLKTGTKVGVNYLKYFGEKLTKGEEEARKSLNENNAEDIYESFSNLKGSTLKVAQMLSMEKNLLPKQYVEKFSLAQFSVPPLSYPLVQKTFRNYFGKNPTEIFDTFSQQSVNAASIGQVHKATKNGKTFAVKIQYPGVANSIASDLKLVKPFATRMFNLRGKDADKYFNEVENKLQEETNYLLEIQQSKQVKNLCAHIPNLIFPTYYEQYSCERIITMDWMEGQHLSEWTAQTVNQERRNKVGQTLWNFYMHQIHHLQNVHADPHPGNFLVNEQDQLIALDFGCMKQLPTNFYTPYFELVNEQTLTNSEQFEAKMWELEILREDDTAEEQAFFKQLFFEMISLFTQPFRSEQFDFSDEAFFSSIYKLSEQYSTNSKLRKFNANRGSRHFIYMNRTFFGLYNLLFDLQANNVIINDYHQFNA